jgi:hypothetical protein
VAGEQAGWCGATRGKGTEGILDPPRGRCGEGQDREEGAARGGKEARSDAP